MYKQFNELGKPLEHRSKGICICVVYCGILDPQYKCQFEFRSWSNEQRWSNRFVEVELVEQRLKVPICILLSECVSSLLLLHTFLRRSFQYIAISSKHFSPDASGRYFWGEFITAIFATWPTCDITEKIGTPLQNKFHEIFCWTRCKSLIV